MNLRALLNDPALPSIELAGLSEHSAAVTADFAFVGVAANEASLSAHCREAVARGATTLLIDAPALVDPNAYGVPVVQVQELAQRRGALAAQFYGNPSAAMTCVGVTGTNGKTSVAHHLASLSSQLGDAMGYSGTLGWGNLPRLQDAGMTTATAVALQQQLAAMRDAGCRAVALEISSHALDQQRAHAVQLDIGVFTNLSRDHLDYHSSFEAYAQAKARLFEDWPLRAAIINVDDPWGAQLAHKHADVAVTYGRHGQWAWSRAVGAPAAEVVWQTPQGEYRQVLHVAADYALDNITAALATLHCMGHEVAALIQALPDLAAVPGRMEVFSAGDDAPTVVVDYAHTPDALEKVLRALRQHCQGRLLCVIGCGGDRDRGKRPLMGECAAQHADAAWFTADNPRGESVMAIIEDMQQALSPTAAAQVQICVERVAAIRAAIGSASAGDVILVAGKGHEPYQEISGVRYASDDRLIVQQCLKEYD